MIILAMLSLAMLANGYHLDNQPTSPTKINILRLMCEHNGANYTAIESAFANFVHCVEVDFEVKMLETEFTDAYMYGSYDAYNKVVKKYCLKTPVLKACHHKLMEAVAPCLEEDFITVSNNVNDQILDYLCESDGNIITTFFMEDGLQCFLDKSYEIKMCVESSWNSILYMEQNRTHLNVRTLSVTQSYRVYDDLLNCILRSVETCHSPTPSRIVKRVSQIIQQSIVQEDSKNDASKTSRKLFKASGNMAVAFKADFYI